MYMICSAIRSALPRFSEGLCHVEELRKSIEPAGPSAWNSGSFAALSSSRVLVLLYGFVSVQRCEPGRSEVAPFSFVTLFRSTITVNEWTPIPGSFTLGKFARPSTCSGTIAKARAPEYVLYVVKCKSNGFANSCSATERISVGRWWSLAPMGVSW